MAHLVPFDIKPKRRRANQNKKLFRISNGRGEKASAKDDAEREEKVEP